MIIRTAIVLKLGVGKFQNFTILEDRVAFMSSCKSDVVIFVVIVANTLYLEIPTPFFTNGVIVKTIINNPMLYFKYIPKLHEISNSKTLCYMLLVRREGIKSCQTEFQQLWCNL